MIFRKAESNEAEKISPFLMLAMKDIVYRFIGEDTTISYGLNRTKSESIFT